MVQALHVKWYISVKPYDLYIKIGLLLHSIAIIVETLLAMTNTLAYKYYHWSKKLYGTSP